MVVIGVGGGGQYTCTRTRLSCVCVQVGQCTCMELVVDYLWANQ